MSIKIYRRILSKIFRMRWTRLINDKTYLKILFKIQLGYNLSFKNPITYNQKLQWLKIYDRNPLYESIVDKSLVRKFVSNLIGEEFLVPILGTWDKFDDIDFSILPDSFVLKCTHDSGGIYICRNKQFFDFEEAKRKINNSMKNNFYYTWREWPYKNIKPRIIAEKYLVDESGYELKDYKIFCFHGKPKFLFVASDRFSEEETKFDFFDLEFQKLPFINGHPNSLKNIIKPDNFQKMLELSEKLSSGFPHVRVDWYNIKGLIYFGELTLTHFSGMVPFEPFEWDVKIGEMLDLTLIGNKN